MNALEALWTDEPRKGRSSRCAVCAGPEAPIRIQVTLAMVSKGGKPVQGKMRSSSVRVCEQHGADLLAQITELLPA